MVAVLCCEYMVHVRERVSYRIASEWVQILAYVSVYRLLQWTFPCIVSLVDHQYFLQRIAIFSKQFSDFYTVKYLSSVNSKFIISLTSFNNTIIVLNYYTI